MDNENKTSKEGVKLTPDQYKEVRTNAKEHLSSEIEYLEVEFKYEKLAADIEEEKLRRLVASARQAQILAPSPEVNSMKDPNKEPDKV